MNKGRAHTHRTRKVTSNVKLLLPPPNPHVVGSEKGDEESVRDKNEGLVWSEKKTPLFSHCANNKTNGLFISTNRGFFFFHFFYEPTTGQRGRMAQPLTEMSHHHPGN